MPAGTRAGRARVLCGKYLAVPWIWYERCESIDEPRRDGCVWVTAGGYC